MDLKYVKRSSPEGKSIHYLGARQIFRYFNLQDREGVSYLAFTDYQVAYFSHPFNSKIIISATAPVQCPLISKQMGLTQRCIARFHFLQCFPNSPLVNSQEGPTICLQRTSLSNTLFSFSSLSCIVSIFL